MDARARKRYVEEDADDGSVCFFDPLDDAVAPEDTWAEWRCETCNQRWPGNEIACGYCGSVRDDADSLGSLG